MGKKYANPPIVEAVCEFRMTADTNWDMTIPGLIYERIKDVFPEKEQHGVQEVEIKEGPEGLQKQVRTSGRVWFLTKEKNAFVQVGDHVLAVNCLAPYPTWESFRPRIESAFQALTSVVVVKGLDRIGLRYINRIEIHDPVIDLNQYFQFRPSLPKSMANEMTDFIVGTVLLPAKTFDRCKVQLATAAFEKADVGNFVLDLDYYLAQGAPLGADKALQWVENAHQQIEAYFEGCIGDRLRAIFGEQ